jgi:NodT family efflux transporter outer membrane factor (OMF) lipoprotein
MMKQITSIVAATVVLTGCTVGPDFRQPEAPQAKRYTMTAQPEVLDDGATHQKLVTGAAVSAEWWQMFGSQDLDGLIAKALNESLSVKAAQARLREVQENMRSQIGAVLFPNFDARADSSRQKISGAAYGGPARIYNVHNASVTASYGLDFFGTSRRYLESLRAQVDYERYQLQAARTTLAANIVTAVVKEASLRRQIAATKQMIADVEEQLVMVRGQYEAGAVTEADLLSQRTALAQVRAGLPSLEKELAQNRHLLNVLAGRLPGDTALPVFTLESLHLPGSLPLSLPSKLVRQRPDILAAESLLHQASANVGVATANMYPSITLSGSYGSEASQISNLFAAGTTVWGAGAGLMQPLFHAGELRFKKRAAEAAFDQAAANYRKVVLQSFQDVADTLQALESDSRSLLLQRDVEASAARTYHLVKAQFEAGAASNLALLDASRQYQQARIEVAKAEATRLADSAALVHALGGGWWNAPETAKKDETEN